jgi:hypothetical protein
MTGLYYEPEPPEPILKTHIIFPSVEAAEAVLSTVGEPVLDESGQETGVRTVDGVQVYPVDYAICEDGRVAIAHPFSDFPTTPEGKESAITIITAALENHPISIKGGKISPAKMNLDSKGVLVDTATTPMITGKLPEDWVQAVKDV